MKVLEPLSHDFVASKRELQELKVLLQSKQDLDENADILPFFRDHKQLCALLAVAHSMKPDRIAFEFPIVGDFVTDLVIGEWAKEYLLIEFEDAKPASLFKQGGRATSSWAPRVSSAFFQIIDWLWKLDDQTNTSDFQHRFGSRQPEIKAIILIGRNASLSDIDRSRLEWMTGKVVIDSSKVFIYTFDDLLALLEDKLQLFEQL